jgi:uncharacterized protein YbjQ (UPF0145 family)
LLSTLLSKEDFVFGKSKSNLCVECGKPRSGLNQDGVCLGCLHDGHARKLAEERAAAEKRRACEEEEELQVRTRASTLLVSTEAWIGDVDRLGVVATEVVLGMNIFRDVLANVKDVFGGRSGAVQTTLEEARTIAFEDLRVKAARLGANAVIAVDIDYHSIGTGSALNMMLVAVSGTAVRQKD